MQAPMSGNGRTQKGAPGVYFTTRTKRPFRIERVSREARDAGHGDGWHLFRDDERDGYCDTYATKRDALDAAEEMGAGDVPTAESDGGQAMQAPMSKREQSREWWKGVVKEFDAMDVSIDRKSVRKGTPRYELVFPDGSARRVWTLREARELARQRVPDDQAYLYWTS